MSHVTGVTPGGPITVAPGSRTRIRVLYTGIPADEVREVRFTGDDNLPIVLQVTLDRADAKLILTGTPAANEILATSTAGTIEYVGNVVGGFDVDLVASA